MDEAQCDGTVYGWRYCFDPGSPPRKIVVAMYNRNSNDNSYQLIPGSRYQVTVEEDVNSFTCRNITLTPSELFPVQRRAVVAICEEQGTNNVKLFFESRSRSRLGFFLVDSCSENDIVESSSILSVQSRVMLLSAYISMFI